MHPENFPNIGNAGRQTDLKSLSKDGQRPYLADIKVIQQRRGHPLVFAETTHNSTWRGFDQWKNSFNSVIVPTRRSVARGENAAKLEFAEGSFHCCPPTNGCSSQIRGLQKSGILWDRD